MSPKENGQKSKTIDPYWREVAQASKFAFEALCGSKKPQLVLIDFLVAQAQVCSVGEWQKLVSEEVDTEILIGIDGIEAWDDFLQNLLGADPFYGLINQPPSKAREQAIRACRYPSR